MPNTNDAEDVLEDQQNEMGTCMRDAMVAVQSINMKGRNIENCKDFAKWPSKSSPSNSLEISCTFSDCLFIWPGRKLGDLGDVGDLGELSPSYSSPSFRVGPICITRKLGDVWKSFRNFSKLSLSQCLSLYSLTACKRISFVV